MRRMLFLLAAMFFGLQVFAQTTITGTVTDEAGDPIPGASVLVKDVAGTGTITDLDGKYSLEAPAGATTLIFSSVGMAAQEIAIAGQTVINANLKVEDKAIDEVVVVAYGKAKKSSLTGAVSSVESETIEKAQTQDVAKALEGTVAGVVVSNSTGQPGANSTIRIRGIGSINASSNPLIILDGSPYPGDLSSINNSDIESVSVLKDAASAALYGARGANGVIIITSKKGKKGKMSIKFDMRIGVNSRGVSEYDIMTDPGEYYETFYEALYNQGIYNKGLSVADAQQFAIYGTKNDDGSVKDPGLYSALGYNIYDVDNNSIVDPKTGKLNPNAKIKYVDADNFNDWSGELFKPQWRQEYNLSISKKTEKNNYFFSIGYLDDDGYSMNSYFDRISTRFSYDGDITKWLKASTSSMFSRTRSNWNSSGGLYSNPFQWTRSIAPIYPVYVHDANGQFLLKNGAKVYDFGEINAGVNEGRKYGSNSNPVATQNENISLNLDYYLSQTAGATATIIDGLTVAVNASLYGNFYEYNYFLTPTGGSGKTYNGISTKYRYNTLSLNLNQIVKYEKKFGDINFSILAGHETFNRKTTYLRGEKSNMVDPNNTEFNNFAKVSSLNSYNRAYKLEGYLGQVTGDFKEKYFLSASFRRDGSSVFHPDHRWGTFWSVGGSWRADKEMFMDNLDFVDLLKFKISYGIQGNDYLYLPSSPKNRYRSWTPYRTLYSITSDGENAGLKASYRGREEVTWEENANFNTGVEISLFDGKIGIEFDYFMRKTNDLLFNLPVPTSTGFSSEPWNIGDMVNEGVEFVLKSRIINTNDVKWDISINGLHYKNRVVRLPDEFKAEGITDGYQKIIEGGSIYDFYMVKYAGVNKENGDAQYWIKNPDTGKFEIKPSKDYESGDSRQYIGTSIPDLQGGFSSYIEAFGFDLNLQFSYQVGGLIYDGVYAGLMSEGGAGENWHLDIRDRWTPTNKDSDIPRVEYNNNKLIQSSDRFMTDASYFAIRSISLGYKLPQSFTKNLRIESLRFYLAADNLYLMSTRKGLDPRVSISGLNTSSLYSPIRTISGGLVLTL